MKWQTIIVFCYAVLVIIGGLMGYLKAQSQMSLIMGSLSGVLLLIAAWGIHRSLNWGLALAFTLTSLLMFFFGYRFYTSQIFMPGGLMTIFSVLTLLSLTFLPSKQHDK